MPFTPFHLGAHSTVALPIAKHLNVIVFVGANFIVDLEPLLVMLFNLDYPLHGYFHSIVGAAILGFFYGLLMYKIKNPVGKILRILHLPYTHTKKQYLIAGVLGAIFHVLFDAPIYADIKPFYPILENPVYGLISKSMMYQICTILFVPALMIFLFFFLRSKFNKST